MGGRGNRAPTVRPSHNLLAGVSGEGGMGSIPPTPPSLCVGGTAPFSPPPLPLDSCSMEQPGRAVQAEGFGVCVPAAALVEQHSSAAQSGLLWGHRPWAPSHPSQAAAEAQLGCLLRERETPDSFHCSQHSPPAPTSSRLWYATGLRQLWGQKPPFFHPCPPTRLHAGLGSESVTDLG